MTAEEAIDILDRCVIGDCEICTKNKKHANDCALPVVAGILADSTICQNAFETDSADNG